MNNEKKKKIESNVRLIVSDFLMKDLPDHDNIFGIINIWDILLSIDGSYLDIYVSSFVKKEELAKTLAKYAYLIQRTIWKKLSMRQNPKVRFRYDDSWEIWEVVTNQINKLDIEEMEEKINKV